jgi:putative zinc finger protein
MTIIDMHPDDLLDRELSGTLSPAEQRRLADHLAQCSGCRLERQLRDDFTHELASARAPDTLSTFVSGALRAALPANGQTPLAMQTPPAPPLPRRSRRRAALLATALVIASGVAAAQAGLVEEVAQFARTQLAKVTGQNPAPASAAAVEATKRSPKPSQLEAPPPAAPEATNDTLAAAEATNDEPAAAQATSVLAAPNDIVEVEERVPTTRKAKARALREARRTRREVALKKASQASAAPVTSDVSPSSRDELPRRAARTAPAAHASDTVALTDVEESSDLPPRARESEPSRSSTSSEPSVSSTSSEPSSTAPSGNELGIMTAPSLFQRANGARHEGRGGEALRLYELLRREFPTSAEARLSLALSARMLLDAGRLGDAIASFDAYLATRDRALHEQAIAGRALALGRLGRTREELSAWRDLLLDYPDSSYAGFATQRLHQDAR